MMVKRLNLKLVQPALKTHKTTPSAIARRPGQLRLQAKPTKQRQRRNRRVGMRIDKRTSPRTVRFAIVTKHQTNKQQTFDVRNQPTRMLHDGNVQLD